MAIVRMPMPVNARRWAAARACLVANMMREVGKVKRRGGRKVVGWKDYYTTRSCKIVGGRNLDNRAWGPRVIFKLGPNAAGQSATRYYDFWVQRDSGATGICMHDDVIWDAFGQ